MASSMEKLQIVQMLLMANADVERRNGKNRRAKEVTKNQRIVYLIEKYEKKRGEGGEEEEEEKEGMKIIEQAEKYIEEFIES